MGNLSKKIEEKKQKLNELYLEKNEREKELRKVEDTIKDSIIDIQKDIYKFIDASYFNFDLLGTSIVKIINSIENKKCHYRIDKSYGDVMLIYINQDEIFRIKPVCEIRPKEEKRFYDYDSINPYAYHPGMTDIRRYGDMYENKLYNECIFMEKEPPRLIFNNYDYGWEYDSKYTYICNCIVEFIDGVIQYKIDNDLTSLTEDEMNMLIDKYISQKRKKINYLDNPSSVHYKEQPILCILSTKINNKGQQ